jgi:hypothetical protein
MHVEVDVEPVQCSRSRADAYGGNIAVLAYISGVGQAKVLKLAGAPLHVRVAISRKLIFQRKQRRCSSVLISAWHPYSVQVLQLMGEDAHLDFTALDPEKRKTNSTSVLVS